MDDTRPGRTVNDIIIKHKSNFFVGIWCGLCLVISAVNGRDLFVLGFDVFAAIINFIYAFAER